MPANHRKKCVDTCQVSLHRWGFSNLSSLRLSCKLRWHIRAQYSIWICFFRSAPNHPRLLDFFPHSPLQHHVLGDVLLLPSALNQCIRPTRAARHHPRHALARPHPDHDLPDSRTLVGQDCDSVRDEFGTSDELMEGPTQALVPRSGCDARLE